MSKDNQIVFEVFSTNRLEVKNWQGRLESVEKRKRLETDLTRILTPAVLADLPPSMQVEQTDRAVNRWVSERAAESTVFLVLSEDRAEIAGLLFLVQFSNDETRADIHIGYLLAESSWGKGYATELVSGLVKSVGPKQSVRFIGGVGKRNIASAKVLLKSGFRRSESLSDAGTDQFVYVTSGD